MYKISVDKTQVTTFEKIPVGAKFEIYGRDYIKIFPVTYTLSNGQKYDVNAVDVFNGGYIIVRNEKEVTLLSFDVIYK